MSKIKDISGERFGRLIVLERCENDIRGHARWLCKCDCGNKKIISSSDLIYGKTKSCGCLKSELSSARRKTHGMSRTKIYGVYMAMINRCNRPEDKSYSNYGGRGITVCDEWLHDFQEFYDWAMSNCYKEGLTIERRDTNKGYCPENCCWIPKPEQSRNRRSNHPITYKGETKLLVDWAKEYNISFKTLSRRIRDGWDVERALTEPAFVGKNQNYNRKENIS